MLKNQKTKIILLVILTISMLAFVGCSQVSEFYIVETEDYCLEVDTVNRTIFDGEYTYEYWILKSDEYYTIQITYPDGETFTAKIYDEVQRYSWSGNYDDETYVSGIILADALSQAAS